MDLLVSILHVGKSGAHPNTLFPLWDKSQATKRQCLLTLRCAALGRGDAGKIKLFLLSLPPMHSDLHFFPSVACWDFSTGNLNFQKSSLPMGNCLRQHFPGTPRPWLKQAGEGSWATIAGTELGQRSLCLLSVTWVAMTLRVTW